jgi:hypothetical protein
VLLSALDCFRWELFTSDALLTTLPLLSLAHDGPEDLIENLFLTRRITVGEFPGTAYLPCCAADGCALRGGFCYRRATSFCQPTRGVLAKRAWGGVPMCDNATTMAVGKYHVEVTLAAAHTAEMRCARYGYVSSLTAKAHQALIASLIRLRLPLSSGMATSRRLRPPPTVRGHRPCKVVSGGATNLATGTSTDALGQQPIRGTCTEHVWYLAAP